MRYKFKIIEDGKPEEEKEAMSFKKVLKSLRKKINIASEVLGEELKSWI